MMSVHSSNEQPGAIGSFIEESSIPQRNHSESNASSDRKGSFSARPLVSKKQLLDVTLDNLRLLKLNSLLLIHIETLEKDSALPNAEILEQV